MKNVEVIFRNLWLIPEATASCCSVLKWGMTWSGLYCRKITLHCSVENELVENVWKDYGWEHLRGYCQLICGQGNGDLKWGGDWDREKSADF